MGSLNVSGRNLNDGITVIDVDQPGVDGMFEPRVLKTPNFSGTNGDGRLNLVGMGAAEDEAGRIRLWLVNMKPSVDSVTGEFLDQTKDGANATIELFRTGAHATKMEHVKTFFHPQIATPNRIAPVGEGNSNAFYFTNDHGIDKTGLVGL
jgi:arylesterase/paraoxonase